ncbi:MAG: hypothetical protein M0015_13025 [Betaproteobacteria bacterium]|nr:hypothetical protein [Betaproteobacteria bacterium]
MSLRAILREIDRVLFFGAIRNTRDLAQAGLGALKRGLRLVLIYVVLPPLFLAALYLLKKLAPGRAVSRASRDRKPRLVWGCNPLANYKFASRAMAAKGYEAKTFVGNFYERIAFKEDYDLYRYELFDVYRRLPRGLVELVEPYLSFIYLIFRFDIFHFAYEGGILAATPLRFQEIQLLHMFGKKVIVAPYGGDAHVLQLMRNTEYKFGQLYHYKHNSVFNILRIRRWIDYFSTHADFCIGSIYFDAIYRYDILPVNYIGIDCDEWRPPEGFECRNNGRDGPVSVVHTPNHRMIKGTEYIVAAVERLKREGYQIDLRLLEGLKNAELKRILGESDILVELLISGYGLSGLEGMALGKPVISNFQTETAVLRHYSYLNECPIVQANPDNIYEKLKELVESPSRRRELGEASRRYALKFHSLLSQQIMWEQIYRQIWYGEPVDLMLLYHPLLGSYAALYEQALAGHSAGSACKTVN